MRYWPAYYYLRVGALRWDAHRRIPINGSRHPNMKELRTQSAGKPIRSFFAFDPRRSAILLIGGDKTGDARFYDRMIRIADRLYDIYLSELRKEGLL